MKSSGMPCPNCSTRLRIHDDSLLGRRVPCPECGVELMVCRETGGTLAVQLSPPETAADSSPHSAAAPHSSRHSAAHASGASAAAAAPLSAVPALSRGERRGSKSAATPPKSKSLPESWHPSPRVVAWLATAGVVAVVVGIIALTQSGNSSPANPAGMPAAHRSTTETATASSSSGPASDRATPGVGTREIMPRETTTSDITSDPVTRDTPPRELPTGTVGSSRPVSSPAGSHESHPREAVLRDTTSRESASREGAGGTLSGVSPLDGRFRQLSQVLQQRLADDRQFPAATVAVPGLAVEKRFSWIARLAPHLDAAGHFPVVWERSWDDPLNESFVRRKFPAVQNPLLKQLAGMDGYPATHFVGITGVGADASRLEKHDRRAGIFGDDRSTRLADIRDGASHTWLLAGVQQQLGSWAAGGHPTARGLTREPYVNGADGFGTGQNESMLLLMADGSVRSVSRQTDPALLRAWAAMADGLPPDSSSTPAGDPVVQGVPATNLPRDPTAPLPTGEVALSPQPLPPASLPVVPPVVPTAPVAGGNPKVAEKPAAGVARPPAETAEPPVAKPPAPERPGRRAATNADVERALEQRLERIDIRQPTPIAELLRDVAEMAGSVLQYDAAELGPDARRLQQTTSFKLDKVTLRDVLDRLVQQVQLQYRLDQGRIVLFPRDAKPAAD